MPRAEIAGLDDARQLAVLTGMGVAEAKAVADLVDPGFGIGAEADHVGGPFHARRVDAHRGFQRGDAQGGRAGFAASADIEPLDQLGPRHAAFDEIDIRDAADGVVDLSVERLPVALGEIVDPVRIDVLRLEPVGQGRGVPGAAEDEAVHDGIPRQGNGFEEVGHRLICPWGKASRSLAVRAGRGSP